MTRFLLLAATLALVPVSAVAQETAVSLGGLHEVLAPYVFMAVSGAVVGLLTWATALFKKWTGIQIEARHREALHSAIMTGVSAALARSRTKAASVTVDVKTQAVKEAVEWAYRSVPDALKYLGASPEVLAELAASKITLLAEAPSGTVTPGKPPGT